MRAALRRLRPAVFYATDFNGLLLNPRGRTAAALYDLTAMHEGLGDPLSAARWKTYYRRLHRCDLLLAISEHTRADAIELLDLDPRLIVAIPLGIDTERFVPSRGEGTFANRRPYFLHIGGRNHNKNQFTLLEAFARAQRELPEVELLLAGPWRAADLAWLDSRARAARADRRPAHRLRRGRVTAVALRQRAGVHLPLAGRGLRLSGARGDGERGARDHLELLFPARGRRRCRRSGGPAGS